MARAKTIQVRARVDHTQPGTQIYRSTGDVFQHTGELYKHVEPVGRAQEAEAAQEFQESGDEE